MKLISFEAWNFRVHAHTKIDFPPAGLIGLVGDNESARAAQRLNDRVRPVSAG